MTFSIAGLDPTTGLLGVAIVSSDPALGGAVYCARADVGAVTAQAAGTSTSDLGAQILDLLSTGLDPEHALLLALNGERAAETSQVTVLAADGRTAAHTGAALATRADHLSAHGAVFAASGPRPARLIDVMAATWQADASAPLAARLRHCLAAGAAARGEDPALASAGLLVVGGVPEDLVVRIDSSETPLADLAHATRWLLNHHVRLA